MNDFSILKESPGQLYVLIEITFWGTNAPFSRLGLAFNQIKDGEISFIANVI